MRFLNCSVCEEDGGVIKGAQNPFLQFVLAIGLDDSAGESPCPMTVDCHLIDKHYYFFT